MCFFRNYRKVWLNTALKNLVYFYFTLCVSVVIYHIESDSVIMVSLLPHFKHKCIRFVQYAIVRLTTVPYVVVYL